MASGSLYGGLIVGWLYYASLDDLSVMAVLAYCTAGTCTWTLVEYVYHRWILHHHAHTMHQQHHHDPDNAQWLGIPLGVTFPGYALLFGLMSLCTDIGEAGLYLSGMSLGYLWYERIHYMAHHSNPRSRLGRSLKRYHLIHHCVEPHHAYGVTTVIWDAVFCTLPKRRAPVASVRRANR